MGRIVAWAGVVLGAVYLLFIGGGWWGIYSPYLRLATVAFAAVVLLAWLVVAIRDPAWRPRTVLWPAILACLGSLAISTLFSRQPRISLEYLAYAVVLAALYLLFVRLLASPFFGRRLVNLFVMLFAITSTLYVGQVVAGWVEWWQLAGLTLPPLRPGFGGLTYGNPSAALTMIALLAVPVVATYGGSSRRGLLVTAFVVVLVAVVAIASGSRAGWFGLGMTAVAAVVAVVVHPGLRAAASNLVGGFRGRSRLLAAAPVAVVVVFGIVVGPVLLQRLLSGGEDLRFSYAVAAMRMFAESPLVGLGPGVWVIEHPGAMLAGEPEFYIPHAHNVEVQTLAELGLVGAVAGIVVVVSVVRLLRFGIRSEDPALRRWAWVGAAGLTYFALHQVLDFYVNMPAFLFAAAIPVAYLDAVASRQPTRQGAPQRIAPVRRVATAGSLMLIAAALAGLALQEVPAIRNEAALVAAANHDWAAARTPAVEAADMDPDIDAYQFTAGLAEAATGNHGAAAKRFEAVVADADLPEAWLNLAAEQAELGKPAAALVAIERALRHGDRRPSITMPAGYLALRLGDAAMARRAFVMAIAIWPSLAGDPWWHADPQRAAMFPDITAEAASREPDAAWEIELMAGMSPEPPDETSRSIASAWRGDRVAYQALLRTCAANPLSSDLLSWCARVARRLQDPDTAEAFSRRIRLISTADVQSAAELRVHEGPMLGVQMPGAPADLWATYTYRRAAPWDVLVGSLLHLHLE